MATSIPMVLSWAGMGAGAKGMMGLIEPDKPKIPKPPDKDSEKVRRAALEARQQMQLRKGRGSTILSSGMGDLSMAPTQRKTLLGE
jgi:hypothetical protein